MYEQGHPAYIKENPCENILPNFHGTWLVSLLKM